MSSETFRSRMMARIYDGFMENAEIAGLATWRRELLQPLSGDVLEIGAGTGINLSYYPTTLTRLILTEPSASMRHRLQDRARQFGHLPLEIAPNGIDDLGVADSSVDTVVSTLVLCGVPSLPTALAEVTRVLRPGGHFIFIEHVAATDNPARLRWQHRLEPIWKYLSSNCHCTRDTETAIIDAGLTLEKITRASIRKAAPIVRPSIRGIARKRQ